MSYTLDESTSSTSLASAGLVDADPAGALDSYFSETSIYSFAFTVP